MKEIHEQARALIDLGHKTVPDLVRMLKTRMSTTEIASSILRSTDDILSDIASAELRHERERADRAARAQWLKETLPERREERKRRAARNKWIDEVHDEDCDRLGLPRDCDAMTLMMARIKETAEEFQKTAVTNFLANLLVPQSIPGRGHKRRGDMTADDCRLVAADYIKRGTTEIGEGVVFTAVADEMERAGVEYAKELVSLPVPS